MDIHKALIRALNKRTIFHSEADFQHHLAWEIHSNNKNIDDVRLEFPLSKDGSNRWEYCDILIRKPIVIGIELKYKTKKLAITIDDEDFELKQQGAQDLGRYDFLKDICRLEQWCKQQKINVGYAILLTNDSSYWSPTIRTDVVDKSFRLHEQSIGGELSWDENTSKGTIKGRESSLILYKNYSLQWFDTSQENFRYLFVKIEC